MNNNKIIEGNIMITRFMGGYLSDHPELNGVKVWHGYDPIEGRLNLPTTLKFHEDWNWLMYVVEKIESIGFDSIITNDSFAPHCKFLHAETTIAGNFGETKIEAVWKTVVEFITWYNKKKEDVKE